jgi:hypothetical protein
MNAKLRRWLPIALCCLPGVMVAAIAGISLAVGGAAFSNAVGGPLGLGLIVLATLACPVSMGLMMWRGSKQSHTHGANNAPVMADCCAPGMVAGASETESADRLAALRARREALEHELVEMQSQ